MQDGAGRGHGGPGMGQQARRRGRGGLLTCLQLSRVIISTVETPKGCPALGPVIMGSLALQPCWVGAEVQGGTPGAPGKGVPEHSHPLYAFYWSWNRCAPVLARQGLPCEVGSGQGLRGAFSGVWQGSG